MVGFCLPFLVGASVKQVPGLFHLLDDLGNEFCVAHVGFIVGKVCGSVSNLFLRLNLGWGLGFGVWGLGFGVE